MQDELVSTIVAGLQETKAHDIQIIDMRHLEEAAFQYFVICEGNSSTHVASIADRMTDYVREHTGQHHLGEVGAQNRLWIAIDYGYVLVHVFQHETREFYRLEFLWEDAKITKVKDEP